MSDGFPNIQKVQAGQPLSSRDATLTKDAKLVNCFVEQTPQGVCAVKRPGTIVVFSPPVGVPQGQFLVQNVPHCIVDDVVYNTTTGAEYPLPNVTVAGQQYSVLSDAPLGRSFIKSASGMWQIQLATLTTPLNMTKVTDANYPPITVSGIAYLDGTYYVMDDAGFVRGSFLEDPFTWPALHFIEADVTLGVGSGIVRHLNYLIAFYTHGTQFYFDAGLTPGLPIAPAGNASWTTGCAVGASIKEASDLTLFISKTRQYGRTVSRFDGMSLSKISTPPVEKILNASTLVGTTSFNIKTAGHAFYGITLTDLSVTLVYDLTLDAWHIWTSTVAGVEQCFTGVNYLGSDTQDLFQDTSTGTVVAMSPTSYQDTTGPISTLVRTVPHSWGTLRMKRYVSMSVNADTTPSTLYVRYTDDDFTTFSPYRAVDLSTRRKMLQRCGMARSRAWDIMHSDNTPLRLFELEFNLTLGTS